MEVNGIVFVRLTFDGTRFSHKRPFSDILVAVTFSTSLSFLAQTHICSHKIKCFIHPNTFPLRPSFPLNGCTNGSGHQPSLSSHIWLKSFLPWTLTMLFIWGQPVTHKLVTILTVVWDCHHSLNCSGGEKGSAITWAFASAFLVLCPHKRPVLTSFPRVHTLRWNRSTSG